MAKAFGNTKGKAEKNVINDYKYKDGEQTIRLVGGILPRYVYWLKGTNDKDIPVECLAFDREKEKFTNVEKDWVQDYFSDKRCQWAYSINCIDPADGAVKVLNLKKKLFEQIMNAAETLGDPTDTTEGWDIIFKRAKTGPLPFNVEYTLSALKCKKRALTPAELEAVEKAKLIDEIYVRPTADEVKALCDRIKNGAPAEEESTAPAGGENIDDLDNA